MADAIRFGKVSSIDYKTGCMEIVYEDREDSVTDMIGMLANAEYKMPKVGDTVVVAHNANGEEEGAIIGTLWGKPSPPPEGGQNLFRKDLDDEAGKCYLKYDGKAKETLFHNEGSTKSETKRDKSEVVEGDSTLEVKGKLVIKVGSCTVTIQGGEIAIQGGSKISMNASEISIDGGTVNISGGSGDATIGGISLVRHTHDYTLPLHPSGLTNTTMPK